MKSNWILRVYNRKVIATVIYRKMIENQTDVTANKIALNIVEREYPGCDWSLMLKDEITS
jgi:hypothetical protein